MKRALPWPKLKRSLIAILRGIRPGEVRDIVSGLVDAGFEAIEIPLNSPDPFRSIETAAQTAPTSVMIGAGTVLTAQDVDRLAAAGGRLLVSPNVDRDVLARATGHRLVTMPGVFTATEAFAAVTAGASALKFFPASVLGPSGIAAIRAVLPAEIEIGAVGGVSDADFPAYRKIGVRTFGLGSSLYRPGASASETQARARQAIAAYDATFAARAA